MTIIFWICWLAELLLLFWWLFQDMKLKHTGLNPFILLGFLYMAVALFIRFSLGAEFLSESMVWIPAIPLLGLLLIIIIYYTADGRAN